MAGQVAAYAKKYKVPIIVPVEMATLGSQRGVTTRIKGTGRTLTSEKKRERDSKKKKSRRRMMEKD